MRKRRALDRDLEDELRFHLEMSGRERFGNPTLIREVCRDMWTFTMVESWWQDLRYALRTLWKNPQVTVAAIVALTLGIGANTTVFTVVNAAFSYPFGVDDPEHMVMIEPSVRLTELSLAELYSNLTQIRDQVKSIQDLAVMRMGSANVSDGAKLPEQFVASMVSASAFPAMRRTPMLGRAFKEEDTRTGAAPVVILSDRMWRSRYGGLNSILGTVIRVDEVPRTVIGVMPPDSRFPADCDLWLPINFLAPGFRPLLFGRLKDGVKITQASIEMDGIARALIHSEPDTLKGLLGLEVRPLLEIYGVYAARPLFYAQLAAVGFVMLIACANVANLLLARAAARSREISIRIAIGAGRSRILRQLLIESVVLSIAGGVFGWILALGGLHWIDRLTAAQGRPAWVNLQMNPRVFAFMAAISILSGLLFGIAPALRLSRVDVNHAVKDGGSGAAGGARGRRLSSALVILEMALCVTLLAGAGLLIHSSINVYESPIGVNPANVLTAEINLPVAKYRTAEQRIAFHRELKQRLEAIAGVESAAIASALPSWGRGIRTLNCELESNTTYAAIGSILVTRNYFQVMQTPPIHGRLFEDSDKDSIAINGILAARFWPGEDPLGKHVRIGETWRTVTAVVPDIQQNVGLQREPLIYLPYTSDSRNAMFITARTQVPPATLSAAFRKEVENIDPNLPLFDVQTLETRVARTRMEIGGIGIVFTVFAVIALALGSVGLYAVSAHAVSQRTREIGIRVAMGGAPGNIAGLVFAQGLRQIAIGLVLGLPLAFGVTRVLRAQLVGVSPFDPATFGGVIVILAIAGALGCAIPGRRALRVDPVVALRCD
jgi:predicted permease